MKSLISAAAGLAGLALLVPVATWAGSSWSLGAEGGVTYDDNAGNAYADADIRSTTRIGAGANATWTGRLGEFTALQLRGALDGEGDTSISQLSFGRVAARVRLLNKPGEGFYVPVLAAWMSADYRASGSQIRSGTDRRVGAYLSEPITTQLAARLAFSWSRRDMNGRSFDGQVRSLELGLDWAPSPQLSVYGQYRMDNGPIVVSARSGSAVGYAAGVEADPAFGAGWYAYRLGARTGVAALGFNVPLSPQLSLDAQLSRAHSVGDVPAAPSGGGGGGGPGPGPGAYSYSSYSYDRWIGGVSLLLQF